MKPAENNIAPRIRILYRDKHILAVEKPAGILSVPATTGAEKSLLCNLRETFNARGLRIYPVHRLDRFTSGVMLFAFDPRTRDALMERFKRREVKKTYLAIVRGRMEPVKGEIRFGLDLAPDRRRVKAGKREAVTAYRVLDLLRGYSLVEVMPKTGVRNQIRAHFFMAGHPLAGERKYTDARTKDGPDAERYMLHAAGIELRHPVSGRMVKIRSRLPADMEAFLGKLNP